MTKYETVIKALSEVDRNTLEMIARGFFKACQYSQYLRYSNVKEIIHSFLKYFSYTDARTVNVTKNGSTFSIFGNIIKTSELERKSYSDIKWNNENEENFDKNTLSIFNEFECCRCDECHLCCYVSVFFIEEFYTYCLEQNFIKVLIEETKIFNEETKKIKEKEEENMDNLRTIAKNLVDNLDRYGEIINNLQDIGVSDEKIYNIFYEILKDIEE